MKADTSMERRRIAKIVLMIREALKSLKVMNMVDRVLREVTYLTNKAWLLHHQLVNIIQILLHLPCMIDLICDFSRRFSNLKHPCSRE